MTRRANVVLITVDSLRNDAWADSAQRSAQCPHLADLAREGILFTQAISNGPRTASSFPAILASTYPLVSLERGIPSWSTSWAEALRARGYTTASFNPDNPYLGREQGYDKGFDYFLDFWEKPQSPAGTAKGGSGSWARAKKTFQDSLGRRSLPALLFFQTLIHGQRSLFLDGERTTEEALCWISRHGDAPFFTWLHYMDVHYPYLPKLGRRLTLQSMRYLAAFIAACLGSNRYPARLARELYQQRVCRVDALIGRFVAGLGNLGLSGETVVIVTSDHGEMFGEHHGFTHGPQPYDELLRVPLILRIPGIEGPIRIGRQVSLLDLAPTILELLGIETPATFSGTSFLKLIRDGENAEEGYVFSEASHPGRRRNRVGESRYRILSCRGRGWKYIFDEEGNQEELYNLEQDPGEHVNLLGQAEVPAGAMRKALREHLNAVEEQRRSHQTEPPPGLDQDEDSLRRRLADLGYL